MNDYGTKIATTLLTSNTNKAYASVFIAVSLLLATAVTYIGGGARTPYSHLFYIAIFAASLFYDFRGGILIGAIAGIVCGPLMPLDVDAGIPQPAADWLLRTVAFSAVGAFNGALIYLMRHPSLPDRGSPFREGGDVPLGQFASTTRTQQHNPGTAAQHGWGSSTASVCAEEQSVDPPSAGGTPKEKEDEPLSDANRHVRLRALREIDKAIIAGTELTRILDRILMQALNYLQVDAADILLFDHESQRMKYAAGRGFSGPADQAESNLPGADRPTDNLSAETGFARPASLTEAGYVTYHVVPLLSKGKTKGVLEIYHSDTITPSPEWLEFLEALAGQAALAVETTELHDEIEQTRRELTEAYNAIIQGWSQALALRDVETIDHTRRVTEMTLQLARAMGVDEKELVHIRRGAQLHDIGKIGIPDSILLKPGPLSNSEWEVMRRHPTYAYELLTPIEYLRPAQHIPYCHHERWDGSGYPRGLHAEEIPLAARIFAVVDVFDALTSDRPYRRAWPEAKALEYIQQQTNKQFDPRVVGVFLDQSIRIESRIHPSYNCK